MIIALAQATAEPWPVDGMGAARGLLAVAVVLGLVVLLAWLLRRGLIPFGPSGRAARAIRIETAAALGERRSLIVVAVEGRRLLLGATPGHVSFITELQGSDAFGRTLDEVTDGHRVAALRDGGTEDPRR